VFGGIRTTAFVLAACIVLTGCDARLRRPSEPADAFLKESMARYHNLASFKTNCDWRADADGTDFGSARTVEYRSPNRYRVLSVHDNTLLLCSVSDGAQVTEYSNVPQMMAGIYPAPPAVGSADSPQMLNPLDCGSPLYSFFGGPDDYAKLVDGPVRYGATMILDKEPCATVLFHNTRYGQMKVAIGTGDKLVHRIEYDAAALVAKGATTEDESAPSSGAPPFLKTLPTKMDALTVVETYHTLSPDATVADADFDTGLPNNIPPFQMANGNGELMAKGGESQGDQSMGNPPVPLGSMAPDITVADAKTGQPLRLSSLRGQVVLLDFWATWCMPCRISLPETQSVFTQYGGRGVAVMAVDNEARGKVLSFVQDSHYTFPVYQDKHFAAFGAFGANAIPTIAIVDRQGRLSSYFVGPQDKETMETALKKAGL